MKTEYEHFWFEKWKRKDKDEADSYICQTHIRNTTIGWVNYKESKYVLEISRGDDDLIFTGQDLRDIADFLDQLNRGDDAVSKA